MAHNMSESGILRRRKPKEKFDDLLVFGYACKVFRDDDKAKTIDQGKHLISWREDENLRVDRYDCRLHLTDIKPYEASREGFDAMRWLGLSESERKLELFCDEERYYSLKINEEEEELYKEEEEKRKSTNEYQYSYDVPGAPENREDIPTVPESNEEEEYVPPLQLDVPVDVAIPKTVKESVRIEKTALFVSKQGPQMEILIKAKQADNPQFGFLNQTDPLFRFYRHVLNAIKSGRYQIKSTAEDVNEDDAQDDRSKGDYLHPSLLPTPPQPEIQQSAVPRVSYKPSPGCAYTQLVTRIQGSQPPVPAAEVAPQMTAEQQQYYYYYAAQYYEYYKQMIQFQQQGQDGGPAVSQDAPLDPSIQQYIQQMAYAQCMQHNPQQQNNSYAQIVSSINKEPQNPYAALMANIQQKFPTTALISENSASNSPKSSSPAPGILEIAGAGAGACAASGTPSAATQSSLEKPSVVVNNNAAKKPILASLIAYGSSDSEASDKETEETVSEAYKIPPKETQVVIDKMASYVSKNGIQFEQIVKSRSDPRFDFLNESHEFYKYYKDKVAELSGESKPFSRRSVGERKAPPAPPVMSKKDKKVIVPVSFSIKKPKEEPQKEIKSALPVEESSDEEDISSKEQDSKNCEEKINPSLLPQEPDEKPPSESEQQKVEEIIAPPSTLPSKSVTKDNGSLDEIDDPILEMIGLTEDLEEKQNARRAQEKIRDKLAAAAREKLALVARDRQIQIERKKKVAAFLKLKSAETSTLGPKGSSSRRSSAETDQKENSENKSSAESEKSKEKRLSDDEDDKFDEKKYDIVNISSDSEEEEKSRKKKSKKKKSHHKRKHSRSSHSSSRSKKKSKRRRRSESRSSDSSS